MGGLIPSLEGGASLQPRWLPAGTAGTRGLLASLARSPPLPSSSSVWRHLLVSTESLWSPHRHCEVRHSLVAISPPAGRWFHDRPDLHATHLLTGRGISSQAGFVRIPTPMFALLNSGRESVIQPSNLAPTFPGEGALLPHPNSTC